MTVGLLKKSYGLHLRSPMTVPARRKPNCIADNLVGCRLFQQPHCPPFSPFLAYQSGFLIASIALISCDFTPFRTNGTFPFLCDRQPDQLSRLAFVLGGFGHQLPTVLPTCPCRSAAATPIAHALGTDLRSAFHPVGTSAFFFTVIQEANVQPRYRRLEP